MTSRAHAALVPLLLVLVLTPCLHRAIPQLKGNAWDDYGAALDLLADTPRYDDPYLLLGDSVFDAEYERAYERLPDISVDEAEAAVAETAEALAALRRGIGKPCEVAWPESEPVDWETRARPVTGVPVSAKARSLARLLAVEAWVHHQQGDASAALSSLEDALTFGKDLVRAPQVEAREAGNDCLRISCRMAQTILPSVADEPALKALRDHLEATCRVVPN